jgi:O-antigen/teichoic acid export membrane protein
MSRTQKALLATAFTYAQWVLTAVTGLFLTRFLVRALGQDVYGTWLATGALLGYAGLADLGLLGVMPWLFAEADGARHTDRLRSLLGNGLIAGAVGGVVYLGVALSIWALLPSLLHLTPTDSDALRGPVIAMSVVTALGYPTRLFSALRLGLQDYSFMGGLGVAQTLLSLALVVVMTSAGKGLYGIALGAAVPPVVGGLLSLVRSRSRNPELLDRWPRFGWPMLRPIITSGMGQWFGSLGWQLAFASDGAVIAYLGRRDLVAVYVVTSRLGLTLMQLSWHLPDNTSVGLAQLNAEGRAERVSEVVSALLRIHLLAAGLIACGVLSGNWGFVTAWIGPDLYGGTILNAVLAVGVIALSVAHALMTPIAVLGRRMSVGLLTLLNGTIHVVLALVFGHAWGLAGVAAATSLSALLSTIPGGVRLLAQMSSLSTRTILVRIAAPYLLRLAPCLVVALTLNWWFVSSNLSSRLGTRAAALANIFAGICVGLGYLLVMRGLMRDLPLTPRIRNLFATLRLV